MAPDGLPPINLLYHAIEKTRQAALITLEENRPMTLTRVQRRLLDAAVSISMDAPEELTFSHSALCQCALPAKRPPTDARRWVRQQGRALLMVEAGSAFHPERNEFVDLPLPHGPKARLILMHLNGEAIRTQSPNITVEDSMTAFVARIQGRTPTGPEIRGVKDQLAALAAATVRMGLHADVGAVQLDTKIVGAFDLWFPRTPNQRILWPSTVRLSLDYFESLSQHAVPLDERAIAALAHSAMALDVYCWLAQRLHRVPHGRGQFIPWTAIYEQFGQSYGQLRFFRRDMLKTLHQVRTAYPSARFDVDGKGMQLLNSPPPVAKRLVQLSAADHV
jgi:hypothetical protein